MQRSGRDLVMMQLTKRAVRGFTTLSKFKGKVCQSAMTLYRIGDMLIAQYH